ncbi:GD12144 [Drosophila simulans]|uniref:GD12144 n=3 Tax=melanogaster subgroup TaxID=32351 RepID=B4QJM6_DROSI|nr:GD12144 [Drosophila simulans]
MGTKSPGGPQRCRLILQRCLAIQLTKPGHTPEDFWMYDSGYMIFQNFLAANAQCWWNGPLTAATRALKYAGHVAPGMLLVTAEPCALEVLRGAFARSVLKPPATYVISSVGDIDDCIVTPTVQGQFTPLPEALCDVIMDLTAEGQSATIEHVRSKLGSRFPHMTTPATEVIYDSLAQLMQEQKIYQTSKGYFIFTPERRRSRSRPRSNHHQLNGSLAYGHLAEEEQQHGDDVVPQEARTMLMSNSEALHSLYGEISTERDGDLTHQCIQTNLADVICGGNPNDKIIYPRAAKRRSASFPTPRSLERRHSLRLFGSSKRLQRCASTRSLSKTYAQTLNTTDSSSSEYQSTDSSSPKKGSLLSRLFRRSGRAKQRQIETYSAQFPPAEWFNTRAVHLHSVGTQTAEHRISRNNRQAKMDPHSADNCKCHKQTQPAQQTLSDMDFDRGIWNAAIYNEVERVREFIKKGQSMDRDGCDYTALHYAARNGNEPICKLLLDEGKADVNAVTKAGATALHRAAMMGHLEIVKLLVEHKANLLLQDECGQTALHRAVMRGHLEVCRILLAKEPTLKLVKDKKDKIAFEYIMENANDDFKLLLKP